MAALIVISVLAIGPIGSLLAQEQPLPESPVSPAVPGFPPGPDESGTILEPTTPPAGDGSSPEVNDEQDILDLALEDLMAVDVVVTSPAKTPRKLSQSASAIYVITRDEIVRSGARSLPDLLRGAPGVFVGRVDSSKWAISVRGNAGFYANKLLVLVDGRNVYTPLFAGVYWDVQDTLLEDIERIEIIRGPGATLWGANAVNGVINIITRHARDSQGNLALAGGGTYERGFGAFRHGGSAGKNAWFRVYGKVLNRAAGYVKHGDAHDDWRQVRAGFRTDWEPGQKDAITIQGDLYQGRCGLEEFLPDFQPPYYRNLVEDMTVGGGNLLGRYTRRFSENSEAILQLYYDRTERLVPELIREEQDTFDADLQYRAPLLGSHEFIGGAHFRECIEHLSFSPTLWFDHPRIETVLASAFVQGEFRIVPDRLHLTVGSKFEYNNFTGFEVQPSGRMIWSPDGRHSLWAAVSRAVRTPNIAEESVHLNLPAEPGPVPGVTLFPRLLGNRRFRSEVLWAYELGYRFRPSSQFSLDLALFLNDYDELASYEPGTPYPEPGLPPGGLVVPVVQDNKVNGTTYGAEIVAEWKPVSGLHIKGTYTLLRVSQSTDNDSLYTGDEFEAEERSSPRQMAMIRTTATMVKDVEGTASLRYTDRLRSQGIPAYVELDLRLAWRPRRDIEVAVVGRNLLDSHHPEFGASSFIPYQVTEVERSVYGMLTLSF